MNASKLALIALVAGALCSTRLDATLFLVTVDTAPLLGLSGFLAFDFTAGAPVPGNSAVISGFSTNGTLGSSSVSGDVSGTLVPGPLTLGDAQFFNEWLQGVTVFGTTLSYQLNLGQNTVSGGIPDEFSFFLLNSAQVPFPTSDPTGADALFAIDLNGANTTASVYTSNFATASVRATGVPEPSTVLLLMAALPILLWRRRDTTQQIRQLRHWTRRSTSCSASDELRRYSQPLARAFERASSASPSAEELRAVRAAASDRYDTRAKFPLEEFSITGVCKEDLARFKRVSRQQYVDD
jgi:hypothetical protein